LFTFQSGTNSWAAAKTNPESGIVSLGTNPSGSSQQSLRIDTTEDGWFGVDETVSPLPLATEGISTLLFDISTGSQETSISVAVQVGSEYRWCQTPYGLIEANTTETLSVDLGALIGSAKACGGSVPSDSSEVRGIWVFFSRGGTYYLDGVRIQESNSGKD
jgi:hypothetical protein